MNEAVWDYESNLWDLEGFVSVFGPRGYLFNTCL